jgi:hypothetical protein
MGIKLAIHKEKVKKMGAKIRNGLHITYSKGRRGREAFSIHPSHHLSMDGIIKGRKLWQKLIPRPSAHVSLSV